MQCAPSRQAGTLEALGSGRPAPVAWDPGSRRLARRSRQPVRGRQAAPGAGQVSTSVIKGQHPGHSQPTAATEPGESRRPATAGACGRA